MRRAKRDGFRIKDAMLAIAASAIGFAWAHAQWEPIQLFAGQYASQPSQTTWILGDRPFYQITRVFTKAVLYAGTALVCPWMVVLLLRARRGGLRGRFWRARRPGAVACLAGTVVLIFELAHQAIRPSAGVHQILYMTQDPRFARVAGWSWDTTRSPAMGDLLRTILIWMPRHAGIVIGGAWLASLLAGAWRPERTWVDRAGRFIGFFWIIAACHFFLLPL